MRMPALLQRCARATLLAAVLLISGRCAAGEPDQILFLHFKLQDGAVKLLSSVVKPGRVKTAVAPEQKGELFLELVTTNGVPLWSGVVPDPTCQRFEYADPDAPGTLKVKEVRVAEAEFTVRVPLLAAARTLKVHRLDRPANRATANAPGPARRLLGSVALPQKAEAR